MPPAGVAITIDPVALITTECITVTSAMRKHARWAHSSVSAILGGASVPYRYAPSSPSNAIDEQVAVEREVNGTSGVVPNRKESEDDGLQSRWGLRGKRGKSMQDNPLMSAFARLRSDLRGCTGRSRQSILLLSH